MEVLQETLQQLISVVNPTGIIDAIIIMEETGVFSVSHLSAYSPMIQIMLAMASGSSKVSRFSHSVAMMLWYLLGYLRNISLITTTASCSSHSKLQVVIAIGINF